VVGADPMHGLDDAPAGEYLVGMNLVFAALLSNQALPERVADRLGKDPIGAYRESGSALQAAFE
jgi:hypothetical protein